MKSCQSCLEVCQALQWSLSTPLAPWGILSSVKVISKFAWHHFPPLPPLSSQKLPLMQRKSDLFFIIMYALHLLAVSSRKLFFKLWNQCCLTLLGTRSLFCHPSCALRHCRRPILLFVVHKLHALGSSTLSVKPVGLMPFAPIVPGKHPSRSNPAPSSFC